MKTFICLSALALSIAANGLTRVANAGEIADATSTFESKANAYYETLGKEKNQIINDQTTKDCLSESSAVRFFSNSCAEAFTSIQVFAEDLAKAMIDLKGAQRAIMDAEGRLRKEVYHNDPTSHWLPELEGAINRNLAFKNFFENGADWITLGISQSKERAKRNNDYQSEVKDWISGIHSEMVASYISFIKVP